MIGHEMKAPLPWIQTEATLNVSGWAAANISLKDHQTSSRPGGNRLRDALIRELAMRGERGKTPYAELVERLPTNTYRAWQEGQWKSLDALRTRIAYLVEHDVSDQHPRPLHDAPSQAAPQPLDDPTYKAVARALETEDQYMASLITEAKLAPLEAEVTRLRLQEPPAEHSGERFSHQDVADILNRSGVSRRTDKPVTTNDVKQAWFRATKKIAPVLKRVVNE